MSRILEPTAMAEAAVDLANYALIELGLEPEEAIPGLVGAIQAVASLTPDAGSAIDEAADLLTSDDPDVLDSYDSDEV